MEETTEQEFNLFDEILKRKDIEFRQKEIENFGKESETEKLKALKELLESIRVDTTEAGIVMYNPALTDKAREQVAKKIMEIVNRM